MSISLPDAIVGGIAFILLFGVIIPFSIVGGIELLAYISTWLYNRRIGKQ